METLGQRWGWEKTKVWRFLKKHGDAFALYRLSGSYGCLIFNKAYPTGTEVSLPDQREVVRIFKEIRFLGTNTPNGNKGQSRFGKLVAWFSRKISRVAVLAPIIRAYISPPESWKNIGPLAKLGKTVKITDTSNQRKAKCETTPAVAVAFRENAKSFDKADGVFNQDTFP